MPPAPSAKAAGSNEGAIFDRAAMSSLIAGASAGIISDGERQRATREGPSAGGPTPPEADLPLVVALAR